MSAYRLEVFLKVGTYFAVLSRIALGKLYVAFAFYFQNHSGPALHGLFCLVHINNIFARFVAGECTIVLQVVEAHHVGNTVSLSGTEAHTAQYASYKGYKGILFGAVGYLAHFNQTGGQKQSANVSLGFFPSAVLAP